MEALPFLANAKAKLGPLYIVHGDEPFLKRQVIRMLRKRALGEEAEEQSVSTYAGDKAEFAEVFDDLDTVPFFDPMRVVLVENADPFVSKYRPELEKRLAHLPDTGMLILDVKTWQANTRLAKMIDSAATVVCKAPASYHLAKWCIDWCASQYQKQLGADAARLLTELVDPEMGLLDQELLKLSIFVGARARIEFADIDRLVGNNHTQDIWKIFDAIGAGNVKTALAIIDRLFDQGEEPLRILGAMTFQLRKLAQATRLSGTGMSLGAAVAQAGVPPFKLKEAEQQIRHLGRRRLDRLYEWLLQMNLDLRGGSPLQARTLFERFLLRLARKNEAVV
ncbi:MAG: DNA polymerase III subunit delta [Planctomycetes bacterium]|nr:DNA polymerase III subunit delta [Planctomycetota bacterium]